MNRRALLAGLLLAVVASGCGVHRYGRGGRPLERSYEVGGVLFEPPAGDGWHVMWRDGRSVTFAKPMPQGRDQSVLIFVIVEDSGKQVRGWAGLREFAEYHLMLDFGSARFRNLTTAMFQERCGGQPALRVRFWVEDRGVPWAPGDLYILQGGSLFVQLPHGGENLVLHVGYSQRAHPGDTFGELAHEVEPLIASVRFEGDHDHGNGSASP